MQKLQVTAISDTHCKFPDSLPGGDLLVHAGDFTYRGRFQEVNEFFGWLEKQLDKYDHIVYIAGNHECSFGERPDEVKKWRAAHSERMIYLEHETTQIKGFNIFGSPYTPSFGWGWAFNVDRGHLHAYWEAVPDTTDLLITHGPPFGFGDFVEEKHWGRDALGQEAWNSVYEHKGDEELFTELKRIKPQAHVFGHFHAAYGKYYPDSLEGVTLINASLCGEDYQLTNKPVSFELLKDPKNV